MFRNFGFGLFVSIWILLFSAFSTEKKLEIKSVKELIAHLDRLETKYEAACFKMGIANWNNYSKEGPADLDTAKNEFATIFLNKENKKVIEEWKNKIDSSNDPVLARRLEMWYRCFLGGMVDTIEEISSLENAMEKRITDFQFKLDGDNITRAQAIKIQRTEIDQDKRHAAWATDSQLSAAMQGDLDRLVRMRNEKAKELGFTNYYSLTLYLQAIDEEWLITTLNDLEKRTRAPFKKFIEESEKNLGTKKLGPWDFRMALRESASLPDEYFPQDKVFEVLKAFEKNLGFPVDHLPIREVVLDIPYGGLSLAIEIPTDSRFLVNPTQGHGFYGTAFHEYGHSLHAVHTKTTYPILKGYEWIPGAQCAAYAEGVAEVHGNMTELEIWLKRYTTVSQEEIDNYIAGVGFPTMYRMRSLLKNFFIEYEMYNDPDQDLAKLEKDMYKKYLLVELDEDEPHQYASSTWYTAYPCYYQNYIIASMIATQVHEAMWERFGMEMVSSNEVAPWMIENLYEMGEASEWTERIEKATGKPLDTGAYLKKLGIE